MNIDGKAGVVYKKEISIQPTFTTYRYFFENGNAYNESQSNWKRTDMSKTVGEDVENMIDKRLHKYAYI